jgi:hypothetical protein
MLFRGWNEKSTARRRMALPAFSAYTVNWLLLETNKNIGIVFLNELGMWRIP